MVPDSVWQLAGTKTVLGVVQYDEPGHERDFIAATDKLHTLYAPVLGDDVQTLRLWRDDLRAGIVAFGHLPHGDAITTPLVLGRALDEYGAASAHSVAVALAEPERNARDLTGLFVLLSNDSNRIRMVTSSCFVHTLKRVQGKGCTAWATRGWAAHTLANKAPRLNRDFIPDFVLFRFLLGPDELLADTVTLPDAMVVDIDRDRSREWNYWSVSDRLAPGEPTDAALLRQGMRQRLAPLRALPAARLGLTAGKDSTFVASCAAEDGLPLTTYTYGHRFDRDVAGARAAAKAAGLPHEFAKRSYGAPTWQRLAELSTWTEGLRVVSGLFGAGDAWSARNVDRFTGHGSEVGLAEYYRTRDPAEWLPSLVSAIREQLPPGVGGTFIERCQAQLCYLESLGRPADNTLDLFFLMNNLAKWFNREIPEPQVDNVVPMFLTADMVRRLLDVPYESRRSGAVLAEAHAAYPPNLHQVAQRTAARHPRLRAYAGVIPGRSVMRTTEELLRTVPHDPITVEILGKEFVQRAFDGARPYIWRRKQAWAILAVEALLARLDGCTT